MWNDKLQMTNTMKQIITCLILMLTFAACGDVAKKPSRMTNDEIASPQPSPQREGEIVAPQNEEIVSQASTVSKSRVGEKVYDHESDNMRGFDPASEDDGDDNGMSRYMENDDEEGWE